MKILIYTINWLPELSGPGKYAGEMSQWLARDHEVRVVTTPPYYPDWQVFEGFSATRYQREEVDGIRVWRCPLWVPSRPSGIKRLLHLASFALSSLPPLFSQVFWRPDVVITVEPALFAAPAAWVVGAFSGAKTWLHVQDFEIDAAFELGILESERAKKIVCGMERCLMRRFDRVSTISERMLERLETKGVRAERRVFFPNWVDCELIWPLDRPSTYRAELGLGPEQLVVLYSGNMGVKQGLEMVVDAARAMREKENVVFVMCGAGAMYEALRARAVGLDNLRWMPLQPLDRLNELLNLADVHVLPQRSDVADLVMPSKLTGILASGRAVLATAHPGTSIAKALENVGEVVPPGDQDAFDAALESLLADAERRRRLGAAGRDYALAHLEQRQILSNFESQLQSCLLGTMPQGVH